MKIIGYEYQSCFAPYIKQFLQEKRSVGFIYETEEWKLKHFDDFCAKESITQPYLSRELIKKWRTLRDGEALSTCSARTSIIRQFALFMTSLGEEAYIPSNFYKCEKRLVHILSDDEISSFFHEIDSYSPEIKAASFLRLSTEYKVLFRLIYCCGLRISEARKLKWSDADLDTGTLKIMHSKGHKDRLVYMSDDLTVLIKEYKAVLSERYGCISEWVFPARETGNCLCSVTINAVFRRAWNATLYAENCDKTPTVHCLRHSFVVKRMNLWMEEGITLREMLPFLSRYLGHQSTDDTFYYYHQVSEAFQIVRARDKTSVFVIPEVAGHE